MKKLLVLVVLLMTLMSLTACGSSTNLYYVVGKSGDWCMIIGAGSRITADMEEAAQQPSVKGSEIRSMKVELDDCFEIPEYIDGTPVTDIEGVAFDGLKGVKYVALPDDVFPEWELESDVIYVVTPGSKAEKRAERSGCEYISYSQYEAQK